MQTESSLIHIVYWCPAFPQQAGDVTKNASQCPASSATLNLFAEHPEVKTLVFGKLFS